MTDREKFEAWRASSSDQDALATWKASRKQALTDALWECQAVINGCFEVDREPAQWCFDAIRDLANPEGEQG